MRLWKTGTAGRRDRRERVREGSGRAIAAARSRGAFGSDRRILEGRSHGRRFATRGARARIARGRGRTGEDLAVLGHGLGHEPDGSLEELRHAADQGKGGDDGRGLERLQDGVREAVEDEREHRHGDERDGHERHDGDAQGVRDHLNLVHHVSRVASADDRAVECLQTRVIDRLQRGESARARVRSGAHDRSLRRDSTSHSPAWHFPKMCNCFPYEKKTNRPPDLEDSARDPDRDLCLPFLGGHSGAHGVANSLRASPTARPSSGGLLGSSEG